MSSGGQTMHKLVSILSRQLWSRYTAIRGSGERSEQGARNQVQTTGGASPDCAISRPLTLYLHIKAKVPVVRELIFKSF